jgi:hypothetical protein
MKCVHNDKCEGHYSDTEAGLFLNPEKHAKLDRQRFGLEKFEVLFFLFILLEFELICRKILDGSSAHSIAISLALLTTSAS